MAATGSRRLMCLATAIVTLFWHGDSLAKPKPQAMSQSGEYACHFGRYGLVVIGEGRDTGTFIIINGKRHSAYGGSYFTKQMTKMIWLSCSDLNLNGSNTKMYETIIVDSLRVRV